MVGKRETMHASLRGLDTVEKSPKELMDILTFVKEINFEIKDNLGFDVMWDSINNRRVNVDTSLLEWFGYDGQDRFMKQVFKKQRNRIPS